MKKVLIVLALFTIQISMAQNEAFIGKWRVVNFTLLNAEELEPEARNGISNIAKNFIDAEFEFQADRSFILSTREDFPEEMESFKSRSRKQWNLVDGVIGIGNDIDGYAYMELVFEKKGNQTYLSFFESPIQFEVRRVN